MREAQPYNVAAGDICFRVWDNRAERVLWIEPATFLARKGSWYTWQDNGGTLFRLNGRWWMSPTMASAVRDFVDGVVACMPSDGPFRIFRDGLEYNRIVAAIRALDLPPDTKVSY